MLIRINLNGPSPKPVFSVFTINVPGIKTDDEFVESLLPIMAL